MEWRKVCKSNTLSEFVYEKTGNNILEIMVPQVNYGFRRFPEVRELLLWAKENHVKTSVVADYDNDGVQSALILAYLLGILQIPYELIMPKRFSEGYGLSEKIVGRIAPGNLLITIDNGIKAVGPIKKAKDKGMKVIILDHHQAGASLPDADVIIDPEAIGEADFKHYCGAGIGYKLAEFMLGKTHPVMPELASFAAVATIGDCVKLIGDNRNIVSEGIGFLREGNTSPGMQKLMEAGRLPEGFSAMDVAFYLVPVLNAPGRLYDDGAKFAVSALYGKGNKEEQITKLIQMNEKRKTLVNQFMSLIDLDALAHSSKKSVFIYNQEIPLGIIGIVAGKIVEATKRPAFVFAKDPDSGLIKGSVRSCSDDYNIINLIETNKHLLEHWGGHEKAAGIGLREEKLKAFEDALNAMLPDVHYEEFIPYDMDVPENRIVELAKDILALEPCGEGNPAPAIRSQIHLVPDSYGKTIRFLGKDKNHVKLFGRGFNLVAFSQKDSLLGNPSPQSIDFIGRVTENVYRGNRSIQIIITDFKILK